MSIPLVQNNEKDSINTSIIAIKRNIERINMLLGLSNSEEIDTSEFVKKSDIVDVVEAGNMNPVTSNAVVKKIFPDYASGNLITSSITSYTATEDCYISFLLIANSSGNRHLLINDVRVSSFDDSNGIYVYTYSGFIKEGDVLKRQDNLEVKPNQLRVYKLA